MATGLEALSLLVGKKEQMMEVTVTSRRGRELWATYTLQMAGVDEGYSINVTDYHGTAG